ncbi:MAG: AmmeMemoRadiSam system protein B [Candidatus Magasanikbacteria bacterium CG11_big_fil_rev_8_21_14_0_20_39_34]|uniref:AmmeMemoRadiSam system protein B n=1 Tax=Candidatus Magasanikbacteria bacterium CG11_big_fil_rev_8_21_14_0_20_39_34 TaxID=1974653 RepID=A0A2H0N5G3_9BACT|nr:MAG: AmmeMemoRadiSam system protein B [Candidatus Magasanikbacteria bacterium CG11_big_fil_rev_8_21_14_0_20_39_34]
MSYTHIGKRYIRLLSLVLVIFLAVSAAATFWVRSLEAQTAFSQAILQLNPYHYTPKGEIPITPQGREPENPFTLPPFPADIRGGIFTFASSSQDMFPSFAKELAGQHPSVIVILGAAGSSYSQTKAYVTDFDFVTEYGLLRSDRKIVNNISEEFSLEKNDSVFVQNQEMNFFIPPIAKFLPKARIVSVLLGESFSEDSLRELAKKLAEELPKDSVVISSVQYPKYDNASVSFFQKEKALHALRNFSFDMQEPKMLPEEYLFLQLMEQLRSQKVLYEGNSSNEFLFGDGEKLEQVMISLVNFGDLMLDRNVANHIKNFGSEYPLSKITQPQKGLFVGQDILAANLEGPFADTRRATSKSIAFRFEPELIPMLTQYHFNLFNLANNHSLDMGSAGFEESKKNLANAGIDFYGKPLQISKTDSVFIKEISQKKIAFVGVDDTLTPLRVSDMESLLKDLRSEVDYIIINIHWGVEYKNISNTRQQMLAHTFIDAGADMVIGHHPHVVEEMEIYHNRPIFYSLGNFVFDQYFSKETQEGLSVGILLDGKSISVYPFPLKSVESQVDLMDENESKLFMDDFLSKSKLDGNEYKDFHFEIEE